MPALAGMGKYEARCWEIPPEGGTTNAAAYDMNVFVVPAFQRSAVVPLSGTNEEAGILTYSGL